MNFDPGQKQILFSLLCDMLDPFDRSNEHFAKHFSLTSQAPSDHRSQTICLVKCLVKCLVNCLVKCLVKCLVLFDH